MPIHKKIIYVVMRSHKLNKLYDLVSTLYHSIFLIFLTG